jgi:FkbM family methyltransferase
MLTGQFEAEEAKVFASELQGCEVFIDVGANIGYYTCLACQLKKEVIAFEPMAYNLRFLYENLKLNGWQDQVEVLPIGAGNKPGICDIYGVSSTGASLVRGWAGSSGLARCTIPINTLDGLLAARMAGRKLLVKMDIEGGEYPALQGARKLLALSPAPVWFVEITLHQFHPGGKNPHFLETFRLFFDAGYQAFTADEAREPVSPAQVESWHSTLSLDNRRYNFLFAKPS